MSTRKAKRALELVGWLAPLTLAYPEFAAILNGSIEELEHEARANPEADNQLVMSAVHLGAWTIRDLMEELPIKRKQLQRILDGHVNIGTIIKQKIKNRGDDGGAPQYLYLPAPPNALRK